MEYTQRPLEACKHTSSGGIFVWPMARSGVLVTSKVCYVAKAGYVLRDLVYWDPRFPERAHFLPAQHHYPTWIPIPLALLTLLRNAHHGLSS